MQWVLLLGLGLLIGLSYLAIRSTVLPVVSAAVARIHARPLPAHWLPILHDRVPVTQRLSAEQQDRLLRSMRALMQNRSWEGCGGLELTEEMQLVISAQACLLVLAHPGEPFPGVREILVYPRSYVPWHADDQLSWVSSNVFPGNPHLGESWSSGTMVLSWENAVEGARDPWDGQNLVLHEFAHALAFDRHLVPDDRSFGFFRGAEKRDRPRVPDPEQWVDVLDATYDMLCLKISSGIPTVLSAYGATSPSEMFAVATEVFFERPRELRDEFPNLYVQLRELYRFDPETLLPPAPAEHAA